MPTRQQMPVDQLWFDVDRPIQTPPRRKSRPRPVLHDQPGLDRQMELRMASPVPVRIMPPPASQPAPLVEEVIALAEPDPEPSQPFSAWLLAQAGQRGALGDLAKAANLDRQFPKAGSADDVRVRLSQAGADSDTFEALEDAEREYVRVVS